MGHSATTLQLLHALHISSQLPESTAAGDAVGAAAAPPPQGQEQPAPAPSTDTGDASDVSYVAAAPLDRAGGAALCACGHQAAEDGAAATAQLTRLARERLKAAVTQLADLLVVAGAGGEGGLRGPMEGHVAHVVSPYGQPWK